MNTVPEEKILDERVESHNEADTQKSLKSRARIAFIRKKYREAIRLLLNKLMADPDDCHTLVELGGAYAKIRDYTASEACFKLALENAADPSVLVGIASSYVTRNEKLKALEILKRILQQYPTNHMAYIHLGRLYQRLGNLKDAREKIETAYRLKPDDEMVINWMGILAFQAGSIIEARTFFQRALALNPGNEVANNHLGRILSEEQKYDKAKRYFFRALQTNPENEFTLYNLASINFREGMFDEAERYLNQIFSSDPNNIFALNLMGKIFNGRGEHKKAMDCYLLILRLHHGDRIALKNLVTLCMKTGNRTQADQYRKQLEKYHPR